MEEGRKNIFERKEVAKMPKPRPRPMSFAMKFNIALSVSSQKTKYSEKPHVGLPKTTFSMFLALIDSNTWPTSLSFSFSGLKGGNYERD